MLRLIPLLILGAGLGAVVGAIVVGDPAYIVAASLAIPVFIVISIFIGTRGMTMRETGLALARIETIQRTGLESKGLQECTIRLVVKPAARAAYQTSTKYFAAPEQLRTLVPGALVVVARATASSPAVTIVTNPPLDWIERVEAARVDPSTVPPASAAPEWSNHSKPGSSSPRKAGGLVVGLVAILAGAALALVPAYGSIARAAESFASGDWDGTSMVTGNYQQLAVDEIAAVAGGYLFTNISFHDSYVIGTAPTSPGADTTDEYQWRYGRAFRDGPELIQPTDLSKELFDASDIDFSLVGPLTEQSIRESGLENVTSVYPRVSPDAASDGAPRIIVYVANDYKDATFIYSTDGELISTN